MKKLIILLLCTLSLIASVYEEAQENRKLGKYEEAIKLYKLAAKEGDKEAQYILGSAYFKGDMVEKDINKSIYLLEKSAEQGFEGAQGLLGFIYLHGLGVEKNIQKALIFNEKAAKQGNANAQNNLADIYTYEMETVNIEKAKYWYTKAVKQDLLHAKCNFAGFLSYFWVDKYLSTYWYIQAYRGGASCAKEGLKRNCKGVELKECAFWIDDLPPIKTDSSKKTKIKKKLLQSETAIVTKTFHTPSTHAIALANDESSIAFAGSESIFVYDFEEMFYKIPLRKASFLSYIKNDEELLAVVSNKLKIFNLKTEQKREVLLKSSIRNSTLSPDKNTLALVSDHQELIVLKIDDMSQERYTLPFVPNSVAYSPDAKSIAVAGKSNTLRIYETEGDYFDLIIKEKTKEEIEQDKLKVDNMGTMLKMLYYKIKALGLDDNSTSNNFSKLMDSLDEEGARSLKRVPKRKINTLLFLDNENVLIGGKNLFLKYNINTLQKTFYSLVEEKTYLNIETMTLYPDGHTLMLTGSQNIVFDLNTEKVVDSVSGVHKILFLSDDEFVSVSKSYNDSINFWKLKKEH